MIAKTLHTLSAQLDDYLKRTFRLTEGVVSLHPVSSDKSTDNKVHLFLVNLERETAGGVSHSRRTVSGNQYRQELPVWQLNLYVMIAAAFGEKQYGEGLQLLSGAAAFLQANNSFALHDASAGVAVEPVNLTFSELSNLWSILGGQYHPSLLCKLRNIAVDAGEVKRVGAIISENETGVNP
ncbi:MAG: DUF4255 domain-containing protein [Prevotellaceae bacterium]|jgi:hypothetical protein|nr:DUF4255 domain-containing protein [Prevotellaceae bacterium]